MSKEDDFAEAFRLLGRALCLTLIAATPPTTPEDSTVAEMDKVWKEFGRAAYFLTDPFMP